MTSVKYYNNYKKIAILLNMFSKQVDLISSKRTPCNLIYFIIGDTIYYILLLVHVDSVFPEICPILVSIRSDFWQHFGLYLVCIMILVVQINNWQHCHGRIYTSVKMPLKKWAQCKSFSVAKLSSCLHKCTV